MTDPGTLYDQIVAFLAWVWSFGEVKFLLGHIALNIVAALAASVYTGEFLLNKTGEFLYRKVLPYILIFAAFAVFGEATNMQAMRAVAFAGLEAKLFADLLDSLKQIGMEAKGRDTPAVSALAKVPKTKEG